MHTGTSSGDDSEITESLINGASDNVPPNNVKADMPAVWRDSTDSPIASQREHSGAGLKVTLQFEYEIKFLEWHSKGDYLATVSADPTSRAIAVHQVHISGRNIHKYDIEIDFQTKKSMAI